MHPSQAQTGGRSGEGSRAEASPGGDGKGSDPADSSAKDNEAGSDYHAPAGAPGYMPPMASSPRAEDRNSTSASPQKASPSDM